MSHTAFVLVPGLGADQDLFYPLQQKFGDRLIVVEDGGDDSLWQQPPSMETAARAFLKRIAAQISPGQDYVLGGMSFGGSLAVEMARLIAREDLLPPPGAIALIASNRTSDSISRGFRVNRAVGSVIPRSLVRGSLRGLSTLFAWREELSQEDKARLRAMAGRARLDRLMWGAKAIANWHCTDQDIDELAIPIHQIHGRHDWVIPVYPPHVTSMIEDGRHLITWTHSEEVNQWLSGLE